VGRPRPATIATEEIGVTSMQFDDFVPRRSFGRRLEPGGDLVLHGAGQDPGAFREYWRALGDRTRPVLYMTYVDLASDVTAYVARLATELAEYDPHGLVPQIGLYFTGSADEDHHPERHYEHAVAEGRHDAEIEALCAGLRTLGRPAFLRIGFEFNGPWFGYKPDPYKAAWIRIVSALRRHGLHDIATVWCYCPLKSRREDPRYTDRDYEPYYPGDEWVDWWAIDMFGPDQFTMENTRWFMADALRRGFPVMIGESTPKDVGGVQAGPAAWDAWFAPYFAFIREHPTVKAFCYINRDWAQYPVWRTWGDARIQQSELVLARYRRELADPLFAHADRPGRPAGLHPSGARPSERPLDAKPRWAPRVPQQKLRRLYEGDAAGRLDEALLEDVGWTLYLRCRAALEVGRLRAERTVRCPRCEALVPIADQHDRSSMLACGCGWRLTWGAYWATFRHQELGPGGAGPIFAGFVRGWERAATARERMLLVDRLIHMWHWETAAERPSFGLGRPTGVNLIEGSRKQVIAFLDGLSYGAAASPEAEAARASWRAGLAYTHAKTRAWHERRRRPDR
jgi:hypothetical protein